MWKDIFVKRKYATIKITQDDINRNLRDSQGIENIKENGEDKQAIEKTKESEKSVQAIDENIFTKCPHCGEILLKSELSSCNSVCSKCGHHFRIDSVKRIEITFDKDSLQYFDDNVRTINPINYPGYNDKVNKLIKTLNINEAVQTGMGKINGLSVCFGVMDSRFIMGSMGSVVGEKLTRMIERACELKLPVIIFSVSGGARMQEGMLSLSQMAKVSAAIKRLANRGLLYISVLTDPTTGGVTASFASLGDIVIAEPGALIGFAGKRVIEQTIRQKLPDDFQSAEFMLEHGFVDMIVDRNNMKNTLYNILKIHRKVG